MPRILDILSEPWAIVPAWHEEIVAIYRARIGGEKLDVSKVEAQLGRPLGRQPQGYQVDSGVALIPIDGVISKRMNLFSEVSGGASLELVGRDIHQAMSDTAVHAIVLQIDSPGGSVHGVHELAREIYGLRGAGKPIVSHAEQMSSAAAWIGTASSEIYISGETAVTGSLGVIGRHVDRTKQDEMKGEKVTEFYAGRFKGLDSEHRPLSADGEAYYQGLVDAIYTVMVNDVAAFRGVDPEAVVKNMAEGRVFVGRQAIDAGLVDGVSTLPALIDDLVAGRKPVKRNTRPAAG